LVALPFKPPSFPIPKVEVQYSDGSRVTTTDRALTSFLRLRSYIFDLVTLVLHSLTNRGHFKGVSELLELIYGNDHKWAKVMLAHTEEEEEPRGLWWNTQIILSILTQLDRLDLGLDLTTNDYQMTLVRPGRTCAKFLTAGGLGSTRIDPQLTTSGPPLTHSDFFVFTEDNECWFDTVGKVETKMAGGCGNNSRKGVEGMNFPVDLTTNPALEF
ncbi:hypothetical protein EDB89DRAFT_2196565, partial [Lactarius sanguifluus]